MRIKTKLTTLMTGLVLTGLLGLTSVPSAAAAPVNRTLTNDTRQRQEVVKVEPTAGEAVTVQTEIDCNNHQLITRLTNTTTVSITPRVSFDSIPASTEYLPTILPGEIGYYTYDFSGNRKPVEIKAAVDGYADTAQMPWISCVEPVSFRVEATSSSAVTGYLQNNSTLLPQTVLTRVGSGDVRTEVLQPGESRLIAMPFTGYPDQRYAYVTIAVTGGYESNYMVKLQQPE